MDKTQFELSADSLKRLDAVKDKMRATRAEVVSNALKVYEWLAENQSSEVRVVDPDGKVLLLTKIINFIK